ncbi:MAG: ABC transporter ATP-binding protein [Magnetococcales bacterium]|nr:ABC transporter ATP-binding protein [Magnetococcales bacterium]
MIRLNKLSYSVHHSGGVLNILKEINWNLEKGSTASVTGPSGSGKTSLLSIIAGLERATSGEIQVAGVDLAGLNEDGLTRLRRENIGVVFQDFHLIDAITAWQNVALPLDFSGKSDSQEQAKHMLQRVGLSHRLNHRPTELSGGERQRVAIARAFVTKPNLILADEPTGNLDKDTSQKVMDLLFEMVAEWQATFVMVTHDRELAGRTHKKFTMLDGCLDLGV